MIVNFIGHTSNEFRSILRFVLCKYHHESCAKGMRLHESKVAMRVMR